MLKNDIVELLSIEVQMKLKKKYVSLTNHNSYCLSNHGKENIRNFNQIK